MTLSSQLDTAMPPHPSPLPRFFACILPSNNTLTLRKKSRERGQHGAVQLGAVPKKLPTVNQLETQLVSLRSLRLTCHTLQKTLDFVGCDKCGGPPFTDTISNPILTGHPQRPW